MYVNCFPLHFCCLQLVTKAMLLYNSAICDLLRESIQIMKILIHLKVVILVSEKWNEHNLMYIYRFYHKQSYKKITETTKTANFSYFPLIFVGNGPKSTNTIQTQTFFSRIGNFFWGIKVMPSESWLPGLYENVVVFVARIFKPKLWLVRIGSNLKTKKPVERQK